MAVKNSRMYPGITLLGIRVFFPDRPSNSYVEVSPPYEIPSFYEDASKPTGLGEMFINKGVVRNVGVLKKVSITILGNNFSNDLYIRLKNQRGEFQDIFIGYLNFTGWKTLTWVNSAIDDQKTTKTLNKDKTPYYPFEYPFVKLAGFIIQRQQTEKSGNFVTMIKDVKIEFDEQFYENSKTEPFQNQEANFTILKQDLIERSVFELKEVNKRLLMQYYEGIKIKRSPK